MSLIVGAIFNAQLTRNSARLLISQLVRQFI